MAALEGSPDLSSPAQKSRGLYLLEVGQTLTIPDNSALVLVDLQIGFVNDETRHLVETVPEFLRDHGPDFKTVIVTEFYNHKQAPFYTIRDWQEMCSDQDCAVWPEIERVLEELGDTHHTFRKSANSGWTEGLEELLRDHEIERVFFLGIDTDMCVLGTAIDCFDAGLRPIVLSEYCASSGGQTPHEAGLVVLRRTLGDEQVWD